MNKLQSSILGRITERHLFQKGVDTEARFLAMGVYQGVPSQEAAEIQVIVEVATRPDVTTTTLLLARTDSQVARGAVTAGTLPNTPDNKSHFAAPYCTTPSSTYEDNAYRLTAVWKGTKCSKPAATT